MNGQEAAFLNDHEGVPIKRAGEVHVLAGHHERQIWPTQIPGTTNSRFVYREAVSHMRF